MAETTHTGQRRNKLSWTAEFFTVFRSIRRPYITFQLPRGDMDTPPRPRNFFRYLAIGMCHFHRLWNGMFDRHQAEITVMQFTGHSLPVHQSMTVPWDFTLSHIVSQARLRDFFPSECVTYFWCITLEWHVWLGRRSIYNRKMSSCVRFCLFVTWDIHTIAFLPNFVFKLLLFCWSLWYLCCFWFL